MRYKDAGVRGEAGRRVLLLCPRKRGRLPTTTSLFRTKMFRGDCHERPHEPRARHDLRQRLQSQGNQRPAPKVVKQSSPHDPQRIGGGTRVVMVVPT